MCRSYNRKAFFPPQKNGLLLSKQKPIALKITPLQKTQKIHI